MTNRELEVLDELGRNHAKQAWIRGGHDLRTVARSPDQMAFEALHGDGREAWSQYQHSYRSELHALNCAAELAQLRTRRRGAA